MTAFHRWLLKNRPYCQIGSCMIPSTRIAEIKNKHVACCDSHWIANHPLQHGYEERQKLERQYR